MYDYMKALHARFCKEPELQKVRAEMERAYREIKARLGQQDQETLLQLADLENELREEASLTSFIAGFRLGMGIAGEMERYCLEDEEETRATERAKMKDPQVKIDVLYKEKSRCRPLFLNFLITVTFPSGYFFFLWYVVLLNKGGDTYERLHEGPAPAVLLGTGASQPLYSPKVNGKRMAPTSPSIQRRCARRSWPG